MKRLAVALVAGSLSSAVVALAPPPPPLPGQVDLGRQLVAAFDKKDVAAYGDLLASNLEVYDEGVLVARNKDEWVRKFGPELVAKGVIFRLSPGYSSTGRLLFIEYFNSMGSWGQVPPPDCCWEYAAVAYDIANGKIIKIQRLKGGAARLNDKGLPASN